MLIAAVIVVGALVLASVGQVVLRHARSPKPRRTTGRAVTVASALLAAIIAIALLRFGVHWMLVGASFVVAVGRRLLPLLRFLPFARTAYRRATAASDGPSGSANGGTQPRSGRMTRHEALEILGLDSRASNEDVQREYRKLMQKVHPDHGGSSYLAAKVNEAREVLL